MAVSVTANLTLVSNADATTGWSGNSGGQDLEVKVQGNASYTWQASKNSRTSCTFTPATNLDMSATDTHLYWWAKNDVAPFMETKTTGTVNTSGYHLRLTDGAGNYKEWHIAGSDTWGGEWKCFVLDVASTRDVYASSGTLDLSDIDIITWYVDISNSGNIRIIDNQWNDVVRFGTGLTATGTDFDITDIAADDELSTNRYGILENIDGVIFCQGRLTIGSGATTTTFNSTDEVIVFRDRDANGEGIVSTDLYQFNFVGSGNTSVVEGLVAKAAGTSDTMRYVLDADDVNADVTMDGCTFIRAGLVTFASTGDIQNSSFNNCFQIDPSTATFKFNTISNYIGTEGGALLWPYSSNSSDLNFINNDEGIELDTATDTTFTNITFDDVSGKFDVNNTSGSAITVTQGGTSNPNSYTGSLVTFQASVTITITVQDRDTDPISAVQTGIFKISDRTEIMNEDTDVNGEAVENYTGATPVDVEIRCRKASAGDTKYKNFSTLATLSGSVFDLLVTMEEDPNNNATT